MIEPKIKKGEKLVAKVELYGEHQSGPKQRRAISQWLRIKAKEIEKEGQDYSTYFKASYYWR